MNRHYLYQMVLKMVFTTGGEIIFNIKLWLLKHEKNYWSAGRLNLKKVLPGHGPETNIFLRVASHLFFTSY